MKGSALVRNGMILAFVIAVGVFIGFDSTHMPWHGRMVNLELTQESQGNIALTESQLRKVVAQKHLTAYWTGPVAGDSYSIDSIDPSQIFIRYLPAGVSAQSASPTYRVVSTYQVPNAFANIQAAAKKKGGFGVLTSDGAAVYYEIAKPTNVYVAYKNSNIEFELYDPDPNLAFGTAIFAKNFQQVK